MKISVVICSRSGIPDRLATSLKEQSVQPDEVLEIVGNSLTAQRNDGASKAKGDLIMFLDDDLILDKHYIERIMEVFYEHLDAMATTGNICAKAFQPHILHTLFAHIFILSRRGQGKFLISGFPETYDKNILDITKSEVLHGCNMTIKKEVFEDTSFNETLEGGMYGEDDYFSYDVSRKYPIYYTPFALCYDERNYPYGEQKWSTRCRIINLIKRYRQRKCDLQERICFWWSMIGFLTLKIIESIIMKDLSILEGIKDACLSKVSDGKLQRTLGSCRSRRSLWGKCSNNAPRNEHKRTLSR